MQHLRSQFSRLIRFLHPASSLEGSLHSIQDFKHWIENNKGSDLIQSISSHGREKDIQRLFHLSASEYLMNNNLDLSCEANAGPGPEDFKISRGNDKTVIEFKLSSNNQYIHGYLEQIHRYAQAENTKNMIYVLFDVGDENRIQKIQELHQKRISEGKDSPILIIIDAKHRKSASKC